MTAGQWQEVQRHFEALNALPRDQHGPLLDAITDEIVREEVASLLANAGGDETIRSAVESVAVLADAALVPRQHIGPYRLPQRTGQGGQGAVYEAVRHDGTFQQRVAIKLVRWEADTEAARQRFRQERQLLAGLSHTNIARLLDGGETSDGVPYLVMEFVEGDPLDRATTGWPLRQKLDLFLHIAAAVAYAHANLIIHRDLKPSNILVTADGTPKLLDFGIAKLLEPGAIATQTLTQCLTPAYASPEQIRGQQVSIATDVYSLGVVLYEVLTGRRPYSTDDATLLELQRIICEQQPDHPRLGNDLDDILLMALRKEPERRYADVREFADDIRRYLAGEAVIARPPSVSYRLGKLTRRHRWWLSAAALFIAVLTAGVVISSFMAVRANQAREEARAVVDFLQKDILSQASVSTQAVGGYKPDPDVRVRVLLDRAADRISGKFSAQPQLEAAIRFTLGTVYKDLGLFPQAEPHLQRSYELRKAAFGEMHSDSIDSASALGDLYALRGENQRAEIWQAKVVQQRRAMFGDSHASTLNARHNLANTYQRMGKYQDAEAAFQSVLVAQLKVLGENHADTSNTMQNLGTVYYRLERPEQAETFTRKALDIRRRVLGPQHPYTVNSVNSLAAISFSLGKVQESEALFREILAIHEKLLGPEHPRTITSLNNVAVAVERQGRLSEAERLLQHALALKNRVLGADHPETLRGKSNLGENLRLQHKTEAASQDLIESLHAQQRKLGASHRDTNTTRVILGRLRLEQGRLQEAEALLAESLAYFEAGMKDSWSRYVCQAELGATLLARGQARAAESHLVTAFDGMLVKRANKSEFDHSDARRAGSYLIRAYRQFNEDNKIRAIEQKLAALAQ